MKRSFTTKLVKYPLPEPKDGRVLMCWAGRIPAIYLNGEWVWEIGKVFIMREGGDLKMPYFELPKEIISQMRPILNGEYVVVNGTTYKAGVYQDEIRLRVKNDDEPYPKKYDGKTPIRHATHEEEMEYTGPQDIVILTFNKKHIS